MTYNEAMRGTCLALLLIAIGCGHKAGSGGNDGPNGDGTNGDGIAAKDSAVDTAIDVPNVKGAVNVQITNAAAGSCMTGMHVVYIDVDGTQTDVTADANGNATGDVFPGGSVTAVCARTTGSYSMATVQDVEPGDNIVLNAAAFFTSEGSQPFDSTPAGSFSVSWTAKSGAAGYTVYGPCGGMTVATTSATLTMQNGCVTSMMDIVVIALASGSVPTAFSEQTAVPFTSGGSVAVADGWHATAGFSGAYSGAPAICADTNDPNYPCSVELDRFVPDLRGLRCDGANTCLAQDISTTASIAETSALGSTAVVQSILTTNGTSVDSIPHAQITTAVVDGTQPTYALDYGTASLPWLCLEAGANCPGWDKTNPTGITVPVTGTEPIDLFEVDATYVRGNSTIMIWHIFGPTPGDFTFPTTLPDSVKVVLPLAGDTKSATHAYACESNAIGGWRPARQNPFETLDTCKSSPSPMANRVPGTINRLSSVN